MAVRPGRGKWRQLRQPVHPRGQEQNHTTAGNRAHSRYCRPGWRGDRADTRDRDHFTSQRGPLSQAAYTQAAVLEGCEADHADVAGFAPVVFLGVV